jgi:hypothetical protein
VGLRPRTIELYQRLLARHITPHLGNVAVASITPDMIRNWRFTLLAAGVSESAAAKAYRLLRAVLATAADDRVIARNPCRIRGAGDEKPAERPVLTVAQVFDLADRIRNPRYKALILLATVAIPAPITAVLTAHLDPYVDQEPTALIFTGALGGILRRGNFRRDTGWAAAVTGTGVPGLHFHDYADPEIPLPRSQAPASPTSKPGWDTTAHAPH